MFAFDVCIYIYIYSMKIYHASIGLDIRWPADISRARVDSMYRITLFRGDPMLTPCCMDSIHDDDMMNA